MQEKSNFDLNQIIGFILIFLLLGGFFYLNQPTEEEKKQFEVEQKKQEQLIQANQQNTTQKKLQSTINKQFQGADTLSTQNNIVAENEKLKIEFSPIGGQISKLELKNHFAYDSLSKNHHKKLYLINQNNEFGLILNDSQGRTINTKNIPFQSNVQNNGNQTIVSMKAKSGESAIEYIYTINDSYSVDFQIKSTNLTQLATNKNVQLEWVQNAFALEKGRTQELTYTDVHFRIKEDQDVDYDSGEWEEEQAVDWVANKQQFFASILAHPKGFLQSKGEVTPYDKDHSSYIKKFTYTAQLPIANNELNHQLRWDFVPLDYDELLPYEKEGYDEIIPFGLWGGGGFIGWLNKNFFLNIYKWLSSIGIAAGWVIFLMTIVVKLILSPVMYKQFRQSAMMKVLRPDMDAINEKYKGKDQAMKRQQEVMALQRKAGVNMLAGCLPALLQMPLFYALFRFFPNLFDLRGKSFFWAEDLTSYDSILELPFTIPMLGSHISLFALLYVVVMVIYFKVSGSLNNFNQAPTQEGMPDMSFMKYMMYIMPIFFFVFLNSYASGLSLYYLVSNGINIGIVLFIKNVMIDEDKIHAKIQENKAKPKKESRWQKKMQQIMEQAQTQQEVQKKKKPKKK